MQVSSNCHPGDAPAGSPYRERLLEMSGGKVRFLGAIYGPAYRQIVAHAGQYIHAHEVGGTNTSLLEAMDVGQSLLYLDVTFNREVAGEAGFPFKKDSNALAKLIDRFTEDRTDILSRKTKAMKIIHEVILSYSRKKYYCSSLSITTADVIRAIAGAIEYFGGVTEEIVIDNPSQMVITHSKKGVVRYNDEFLRFCGLYA